MSVCVCVCVCVCVERSKQSEGEGIECKKNLCSELHLHANEGGEWEGNSRNCLDFLMRGAKEQ